MSVNFPLLPFFPISVGFLSYNQVDIVVGTPGRLDDLISTGKLSLSQVRFLVLDECVCPSTVFHQFLKKFSIKM